ncbi:11904_t:CDS:2 [Funneliformis caledonium]|uniref:11904_t:CDS:1 n=1 Tax=Funneliformis caledonium TaxID=1117310 RepID=A0A9N8VUL6_9GLOM|nr:11904_t:CDS:2 [Funneliformis caledonium]
MKSISVPAGYGIVKITCEELIIEKVFNLVPFPSTIPDLTDPKCHNDGNLIETSFATFYVLE